MSIAWASGAIGLQGGECAAILHGLTFTKRNIAHAHIGVQ